MSYFRQITLNAIGRHNESTLSPTSPPFSSFPPSLSLFLSALLFFLDLVMIWVHLPYSLLSLPGDEELFHITGWGTRWKTGQSQATWLNKDT